MSLKEANVTYKLLFEHNMSHCIFKCAFESILLCPSCLLAYVPKCLFIKQVWLSRA